MNAAKFVEGSAGHVVVLGGGETLELAHKEIEYWELPLVHLEPGHSGWEARWDSLVHVAFVPYSYDPPSVFGT